MAPEYKTPRRYGKKCSRDVDAIRNVVKTRMLNFAREWAERGGGTAHEWWAYLREKLGAEIKALPVKCVRRGAVAPTD